MVDHGEERKEALRRYEAACSLAVDIVECQMLDDRKTAILSAVVRSISTAPSWVLPTLLARLEWVSLPQQFEMRTCPLEQEDFLYNRTRQPVESQPIKDTDTSSTTSQRPALLIWLRQLRSATFSLLHTAVSKRCCIKLPTCLRIYQFQS